MYRILLAIALICICSTANAAERLQVDFAFTQEPAPQSYRFYLDGTLQCEFQEDGTKQGSCEIEPLPYGESTFTLTAVSGDKESPHSPVYVFDKILNAPTINTVFTISVSIVK